MSKEEELARRWMPGRRQGPAQRHAWEHPADLVRLLTTELPLEVIPEELERRVALAWLHDIIEDGRKEDGQRVTVSDLFEANIGGEIVNDVIAMSHHASEPKATYLARLKEQNARVKVVKCVDRICNLREGKDAFKDRRWIRYVGETYYFIYPLTEDLSEGPERSWLQANLIRAVQARELRTNTMYPDPTRP